MFQTDAIHQPVCSYFNQKDPNTEKSLVSLKDADLFHGIVIASDNLEMDWPYTQKGRWA